ncbi:hypothetical protein O1611_g10420 [Lasiodiplodia mahajangana]|uniref:Uncharacterized protein n=1 Tax=Lasiodiplodia mahajangana TaxID=1108764 RepID=A0ACC2IYJ8_9PEZI|nr:hypothetical protein O1611_g10420 [Lasiodiplodia mahajangana]
MEQQEITYSHPIRSGSREYRESSDGKQWYRKIRNGVWGEWELYTPEQPAQVQEASSSCLWLVRQTQPAGPYHWQLAIASEEGGVGDVYQVTGDAVHMHYNHLKNEDIFIADDYFDSYNLGPLDDNGRRMVEFCAGNQLPPTAENAAAVTENCQGWVIRVLKDLEARGVIAQGTAASHQRMMEPCRK